MSGMRAWWSTLAGLALVLTLPLLVLEAPPALAAPAAGADAGRLAGVDEAARDAVAAGDLPGAVILIAREGRTVHRSAVGSRALQPAAEPMTVDTIFDVAS